MFENEGYQILAMQVTNGRGFALGHNPSSPEPYVVWHYKDGDYFWGNYFTNYEEAASLFLEKAVN